MKACNVIDMLVQKHIPRNRNLRHPMPKPPFLSRGCSKGTDLKMFSTFCLTTSDHQAHCHAVLQIRVRSMRLGGPSLHYRMLVSTTYGMHVGSSKIVESVKA